MRESNLLVTYGDTLTDVDVGSVVDTYEKVDQVCAITTVTRPNKRFSTVLWDKSTGVVNSFSEKEGREDFYLGCGFILLPSAKDFEYPSAGTSLEKEILPLMATRRRLRAVEHNGFWHPVDYLHDIASIEMEYANKSPYEWPWLK